MNNVGYLTASKTPEAQEMYTPFYGVKPILKYIPKEATVWCPFDEEWSAYVQMIKNNGNKVIRSHISEGKDFFNYEPEEKYDCIVSNPPFSIKDEILKRLYKLNKPFAMLLPLNSLQGRKRFELFKNGIQLLAFDSRMGFHNQNKMDKPVEGTPFASAYFCRNFLPRDLILESLVKYDLPLIGENNG